MSPKNIALLIVGMVLVSSVFFIFHVSYPANPATIKINHVPKQIKPQNYKIFSNQTYNQPGLGLNQTSFTPTGNTTLTLQGFVLNASSPGGKQPIADQVLGVAVMQALTLVRTNSQGFYQVKILASGQGTFAFKIFQYLTAYKTLYIGQGISVLKQNISLTPQAKYQVSGLTESHGKALSGVYLTFSSFWGKYYTTSSSSGDYSINMVNANYTIASIKSGFEPVPSPLFANVTNSPISNYNLNLFSTSQAAFYMNGYLSNPLGHKIGNAIIYDSTIRASNAFNVSQPDGFYNISVAYYSNTINANATGYTPFATNVIVYHNLTNENFTIQALDPFLGPSSQTGITSGEPKGLGNNISNVDYGNPQGTIFITGQVKSSQTKMLVPNQQFNLFTSVNGTYFNDLISTNSTGYYKVSLLFSGDYHLNVTSAQYYDTWLNESLSRSASGQTIYVTTSPNKVYHLSGGVINGATGSPLANATIQIYSSSGGYLTTVHTNATGQFNVSLLGGTYNISVSTPGFGTSNLTVPVNGNLTLPPINITPTSSIAPGSGTWKSSSGSGLPGVNGTSISNQLNSTQNSTGIVPGTNSSTPVSLNLRMMDNATNTPINNTAYEMFIRVNGLTLNLTGSTGSNGYTYLNLSYGGSYILLPEMIDYSGIAKLVNTSQYQGKTLVLYLNPLTVYNLSVNLSSPLNGQKVPVNDLSVSGYSLPVNANYTYGGSNYSKFSYIVPNGTFYFKYSNVSFVSKSFTVKVSGSDVNDKVPLKPYVLFLSWSTNVSWSYTMSGPGAPLNGNGGVGTSSTYIPLEAGTYGFDAYLGNNLVGSPQQFTLTSSTPNTSLSFSTGYHAEHINGIGNWTYNGKTGVFQVNTTIDQAQVYYISQIGINANLPTSSTLYLNGAQSGTLNGASNFTIANYFATSQSGQTSISIIANNFNDYQVLSEYGQYGVNMTISYYTASLTG